MAKSTTEVLAIELKKDRIGMIDAVVRAAKGRITEVGSMKRYVVMSVDSSESSDGKPHVLDVLERKEDAKAFVRNEIERCADYFAGTDLVVDFEKMNAHSEDYSFSCEWNIDEVEIKL